MQTQMYCTLYMYIHTHMHIHTHACTRTRTRTRTRTHTQNNSYMASSGMYEPCNALAGFIHRALQGSYMPGSYMPLERKVYTEQQHTDQTTNQPPSPATKYIVYSYVFYFVLGWIAVCTVVQELYL